jgi:hypothetical protein
VGQRGGFAEKALGEAVGVELRSRVLSLSLSLSFLLRLAWLSLATIPGAV